MTAVTCHRHSHGGYLYNGDHNNSNNSRPLHIVQTSLAPTPLAPGTTDTASCLAGSQLSPSLDITSSTLNNLPDTNTATLVLTGITVDTCTSSTKLDPALHDLVDDMSVSEPQDKHTKSTPPSSVSGKSRIPKRKRTVSPPSPSSSSPGGHRRSTSRSTRRSTNTNYQNSVHSHRRAATVTALTPSVPSKDPEIKREDLLALHRESCRLFQDSDNTKSNQPAEPPAPSNVPTAPQDTIPASSEAGSPPVSPVLRTQLSFTSKNPASQNLKGPTLRTSSVASTALDEIYSSPVHTSATVIDWTSPSTRRREYKKIDRASSGVRGFWRRVAPKWCQSRQDRTPFFEEKDGKGNYEGSVRRFRMDLPDDPVPDQKLSAIRGLKLKQKLATSKMSNRRRAD
ncbi:hypothetical protein BDV25DRAFT_2180 [Aspergillus avenaceus]|uniref:Uncharacterized protein n=1 Tax=Aspergillus avenaceus TaxID=36643 RepID=A0A5N6TTM8_ASPAV|nr:hypothetical protein BDV25DRAFT_2180 [Aspergillus avenaceus]